MHVCRERLLDTEWGPGSALRGTCHHCKLCQFKSELEINLLRVWACLTVNTCSCVHIIFGFYLTTPSYLKAD